VVPRFADRPRASGLLGFGVGPWSAAYDYAALGSIADFVVLMTYDHFNRNTVPGPIAGYDWVSRALGYAVTKMPREKIVLGLPFYGREWAEDEQGLISKSLNFGDVSVLLKRPDLVMEWDEQWRSPWFQYQDGVTRRTVWFEDARSLGAKLDLVRLYDVRGFAAWRLGVEDPSFWECARHKPLTDAAAAATRVSRSPTPMRATSSNVRGCP